MKGYEHYAEAERLIALAESCDWTEGIGGTYLVPALAAAQVHATLAQVAATMESHLGFRSMGYQPWQAAFNDQTHNLRAGETDGASTTPKDT